jgi:hypothetical protein
MRSLPNPRRPTAKHRAAYTLLEVLLALALSVVVFAAIAMAIKIHLVALAQQQTMIERKQIARSVLEMMGNDLRAAIQYKAADYSGLENLLATQQLAAGPALEDPADAAAAAEEMENSARESEEEPAEEEPQIIIEEEVSFRPSMIGNESVLMVDISRLPRVDQYNPLIVSADSLLQSPSDVKSIAYFFSSATGGVESEIDFEAAAETGGLYRREVDRAVAAYMGDVGLVSQPDAQSKLLAAEIAQVGFRYFDGTDWQTEWDSEENNGFPPAIEIEIVIDPARISKDNTTYSYNGFDRETMQVFRSVVHLPVAEVIEEE